MHMHDYVINNTNHQGPTKHCILYYINQRFTSILHIGNDPKDENDAGIKIRECNLSTPKKL